MGIRGELVRGLARGVVVWVLAVALAELPGAAQAGAKGAGDGGKPGVSHGSVSRAQGPVRVREVMFSGDKATACQPGDREFVLEELGDLYVCVVWQGLAGTYAAQLTFLLPDGNVYQTMTLAFVTAEAPVTVTEVEVEGRRHEVKRAGWGRRGETVVVAMLPVAGTHITQYTLAGLWTVKVSLNGQAVDEDYFILHPTRPRHPRK